MLFHLFKALQLEHFSLLLCAYLYKNVSIWVSRNPRIESRQSFIFAPAVVAGWKHELLAQARWHLKEIRAYGPFGMYLFAKQRMFVTNVLFLRTLYVNCTKMIFCEHLRQLQGVGDGGKGGMGGGGGG